jgi:predicted AAA+ superfamily ATPase
MITRRRSFEGLGPESCFLWGPRQTGKSTLLRHLFPRATYHDLLHANELARLAARPQLLREEIEARPPPAGEPVIIDEIQKVPALLDEVHSHSAALRPQPKRT